MMPAADCLGRPYAGITAPDSAIARAAMSLALRAYSTVLFNHVMRSYYFGRLVLPSLVSVDDEVIFLSALLHDLGLTDHARAPRRFEVESAGAAFQFLTEQGLDERRAWLVWDTIALHTTDLNPYKESEAQIVQAGIVADVTGAGLERVPAAAVTEILDVFPREDFKRSFYALLEAEARSKPDAHTFHPTYMIAHHHCGGAGVPDAKALIEAAPFLE